MSTELQAAPDQEAGVSVAENPPRENLVRAVLPGAQLEERAAGDGIGVLKGEFAVFNEWTEINSAWEGNFLERIAPTAFNKTFAENRQGMKVLYDHGHDPQIGNKPLGTISDLRATDTGAYYEVPLFDTSYNRDLLPGLKAGVYGASFRFKVMREEFDKTPERSDYNPNRLPERTITEARVMEFGPVTFPAYEGASAGVRSLTDEYIVSQIFGSPDRVRSLLESLVPSRDESTGPTPAPSEEAAPVALQPERREVPAKKFDSREEWLEWISKT
jgi:HK97 family phage prohead protease